MLFLLTQAQTIVVGRGVAPRLGLKVTPTLPTQSLAPIDPSHSTSLCHLNEIQLPVQTLTWVHTHTHTT